MLRRALVFFLLVSYGCADSGPVGPTTIRRDVAAPANAAGIVAGTTLSIVSGETGQPVTGALVTVAGQEHVSDGSGHVTLEQLAPNGATVAVEAPGFLERRTVVRRGEQTVFELWPSTSPTGMTSEYTRALVYASASIEDEGMLEPMDRPALDNPHVAIEPSDAIRRDALAMQRLEDAASRITEALGGAFTYRVGANPSAVPVTLTVEPENPQITEENLRAFARCFRSRLQITRCEIVFRSVEVVRSDTTLHELGHTFGLNHSPDPREVMGVRRVAAPGRFSPRESLAMRLMMKRRPGNLFPDDGRQAPSLRALGETGVIVCRHP